MRNGVGVGRGTWTREGVGSHVRRGEGGFESSIRWWTRLLALLCLVLGPWVNKISKPILGLRLQKKGLFSFLIFNGLKFFEQRKAAS